MTITDDFIPNDYLLISSDIENSIKSNTSIQIQKNSAWLRCAVSRAYYSAFLSIRSEFEKNSELRLLLTGEGQDHGIIIQKLSTLSGQMKQYSNKLRNLRKNRNHCDYHLPPTFTIGMGVVEGANSDAKKLVDNSAYIVNNLPCD